MFASHRNRAPPNTPHRQVPVNVPSTPPSPSTLAGTPSAPSRTWSMGTIPICFDQNPPIMRLYPDDSPTFPSSGGSAASSPNPNRSPRAPDVDHSPAPRSYPSSTLKKMWKGRFMGGSSEEETRPRYRGLNITTQAPSAASSLSTSSKTRSILSTPLPHIVEGQATLNVDDAIDNDDALSCFSLSAYMRADSDGDETSRSRHGTPALGSAIAFDAPLPPVTESIEVAASSSSQPTESTYISSEQSIQMGTSSSCETAVSEEVTTPIKARHPYMAGSHHSPETPITFAYPRPGFGLSPTQTLGFEEQQELPGTILQKQLPLLPLVARDREIRLMQSKQSLDSGTRTSSSLSTMEEAERQAVIGAQLRNISPRIEFLKDARVELHIDQEGFRYIKPVLTFHRHSFNPPTLGFGTEPVKMRHSRSNSSSSPVDGPEGEEYMEFGMAEFQMKKREPFIFHYASLDSAPTLRRVTVNNQEGKDYISRQASLSLKGNGVYTVQAFEDKGKLFWKLEYLVDDRRAPNGQPIAGEKTFTPLSFSCSPLLLDPERAQKIHIFQVVKKSVAPKLVSTKLKPPPLPLTSPTKTSFSRPSTEEDRSPTSAGTKSSFFTKVLSRPTTPKRPVTPKRPPVVARDQPPQTEPPKSLGKKSRQRSASVSTQARPSTATRTDWGKLFPVPAHMAQQDPSPPPTSSSTRHFQYAAPYPPMSATAPRSVLRNAAPGPGAKIVTQAQIQAWMSNVATAQASPLAPPRSNEARRPSPRGPQRPSTATNAEGRPWAMI